MTRIPSEFTPSQSNLHPTKSFWDEVPISTSIQMTVDVEELKKDVNICYSIRIIPWLGNNMLFLKLGQCCEERKHLKCRCQRNAASGYCCKMVKDSTGYGRRTLGGGQRSRWSWSDLVYNRTCFALMHHYLDSVEAYLAAVIFASTTTLSEWCIWWSILGRTRQFPA